MEDPPKRIKLDQIRELNNLAGTCMKLAHTFYKDRELSFKESTETINSLLDRMKECEEEMVEDAKHILSLLSHYITHWLKKTVTPNGISKQLRYTNELGQLSSVIALTLKWSPNGAIGLETNKFLMDIIFHWNHNFHSKIKIVGWPTSKSCLMPYPKLMPPPESTFSLLVKLNPDRLLCHATSTVNAINILLKGSSTHIRLVSNANETVVDKNDVTSKVSSGHVWCGVALTTEEAKSIPGDAGRYARENRYGSVKFTFPIGKTRAWAENSQVFIFGTRQYPCEYSQVLFVSSPSSENYNYFQVQISEGYPNGKLSELQTVNIDGYEWMLQYGKSLWTQPELSFHENLQIPISGLKLSFSEHSCRLEKVESCADCTLKIRRKSEAILRFKTLVNSHLEKPKFVKLLAPMLDPQDYASIFGESETE